MKILVAEDNLDLLSLIRIYLKFLKHEVLTACDGVEALEIFKSNQDIEMVIIDIDMPRLNGYIALKQMRELKPNLKAIVISGCVKKEQMPSDETNIIKPFRISQLIDIMDKL